MKGVTVSSESDPHDVDPDRIKHIAVAKTVVGGRTMYPKN
jgi:predicted amidohydrolase YtcJ